MTSFEGRVPGYGLMFAATAQADGFVTSSCALQMGYNLLYGLQKASYDADCSLFLNILKEEVKVRAA